MKQLEVTVKFIFFEEGNNKYSNKIEIDNPHDVPNAVISAMCRVLMKDVMNDLRKEIMEISGKYDDNLPQYIEGLINSADAMVSTDLMRMEQAFKNIKTSEDDSK